VDSNSQPGGPGQSGDEALWRHDLVAVVTQEMRTPLTVLKGYTQRLLMSWETLDDRGKQAILGRINTSVSRLQRLVDDIMLVSGGQTADLVMMARPYLLEQVVQHAILEVGARRGDRATMIMPTGHNVSMYGDQYRTEQIVITLLELAVVRSPHEAVIAVTYGDRDGIAHLSVTDRGPALTPSGWDALLGRRDAPDRDRAGSPAALSLDLLIADRLVTLMGGALRATSDDEASHVLLELPISPS